MFLFTFIFFQFHLQQPLLLVSVVNFSLFCNVCFTFVGDMTCYDVVGERQLDAHALIKTTSMRTSLHSAFIKPGFHIVVSVVSVVRKKFIGQIQLYGNLPYKCSIQQKRDLYNLLYNLLYEKE